MTGLIITQDQAARYWLKERTEKSQAHFFRSVRPVYGLTHSDTPMAVGTSFLFQVDGRKFLITAAHVIDWNQQTTLYVAGLATLEQITGDAGVTKAPVTGRTGDKYDFAFMELSNEFAERVGADAFLNADDVSENRGTMEGRCFMALGYPASRNKPKPLAITGTHAVGKSWVYSDSCHLTDKVFNDVGASPERHLLLKFGKRSKAFSGEVTNSINPQGASGGILVDLGRIDPAMLAPSAPFIPRLAGVLIEHHSSSKAIVATKIQLIIDAIRKF